MSTQSTGTLSSHSGVKFLLKFAILISGIPAALYLGFRGIDHFRWILLPELTRQCTSEASSLAIISRDGFFMLAVIGTVTCACFMIKNVFTNRSTRHGLKIAAAVIVLGGLALGHQYIFPITGTNYPTTQNAQEPMTPKNYLVKAHWGYDSWPECGAFRNARGLGWDYDAKVLGWPMIVMGIWLASTSMILSAVGRKPEEDSPNPSRGSGTDFEATT